MGPRACVQVGSIPERRNVKLADEFKAACQHEQLPNSSQHPETRHQPVNSNSQGEQTREH